MNRVNEPNNKITIEIPAGFIVFCDMDGTLIDTDYANYLSYRHATIEATKGNHVIEPTNERLNMKSLRKQLPFLTADQYNEIIKLKADYFRTFLSETRINTTLVKLLTEFSRTNKIVLVTCCRSKRAIETLMHHNLIGLFSQFICFEDLPKDESSNKYESALNIIDVKPDNVLIFENDRNDIKKAMNAGVPINNIISQYF